MFARVQGMLGSDGVLRASLVGGRGPAERVARVPFGDPSPLGVSVAGLPWPGRLPAPSPSVVSDEVVFVEVLDETGTAVAVDARGTVSRPPV
ncbi:MAG: DNA polymerase Y family protein, partial [Thermoplasmata archaeon]|nr:DNA polymerase Y family protein [Thermoplasmata archaeon]